MIAFSVEFSGGLMNWGKNFMSIFKYGLKRAGTRLLIKLLGKKAAVAILGKGAVATATTATATTATATTATAVTGTTSTAAGIGAGAVAGIVAGAGLLASGLGEGIFQLRKKGKEQEADSYKRFKEKSWLNPMKYVFGAVHLSQKFSNFQMAIIGNILDIVGAPFRYIIELVRYPFLDEAGKAKQRENLAKFDARIREHFREMVNTLSLGMLAKDKGAFGSLFGKKGTDAMGYTKNGKSVSEKTNSISEYTSYEQGTDETVIIRSGSETGDVAPETQIKESLAPVVVGGGGGSREIDEAHYKGS
jgi:hypothetical protein